MSVEYAKEKQQFEDVVEDKGRQVLHPRRRPPCSCRAARWDWVEDKFNSRFEFINPNEKGRCGCGEPLSI